MAKRTKADVAKATGMSMTTLNELLNYIQAEVAAGNTVQLTGFGTFKPGVLRGREVRVPSTGATKKTTAKFRPKFSPGTDFKAQVETARRP